MLGPLEKDDRVGPEQAHFDRPVHFAPVLQREPAARHHRRHQVPPQRREAGKENQILIYKLKIYLIRNLLGLWSTRRSLLPEETYTYKRTFKRFSVIPL